MPVMVLPTGCMVSCYGALTQCRVVHDFLTDTERKREPKTIIVCNFLIVDRYRQCEGPCS